MINKINSLVLFCFLVIASTAHSAETENTTKQSSHPVKEQKSKPVKEQKSKNAKNDLAKN
jgi:hypothetical protein